MKFHKIKCAKLNQIDYNKIKKNDTADKEEMNMVLTAIIENTENLAGVQDTLAALGATLSSNTIGSKTTNFISYKALRTQDRNTIKITLSAAVAKYTNLIWLV
jgi:hypothetical protein